MELAPEEIWMSGDLNDLNISSVRSGSGDAQPGAGEQSLIFAVELVAVAVAFADFGRAVCIGRNGAGFELAFPGAQAHCTAELVDALELSQLVDDAMLGAGVKLARICVVKPADIARVFDAGGLHAKTNSEKRNMPFARVADRIDHSCDAALPKSSRHENAVEPFKLRFKGAIIRIFALETLSLDPGHVQLEIVRQCAVYQGFFEGFV